MAKHKTRQQLAQEYGFSRSTLYRELKKANIQLSKGLITPKEQEKIYQELGRPSLNKQTNKQTNSDQ